MGANHDDLNDFGKSRGYRMEPLHGGVVMRLRLLNSRGGT